MSIQKHRFVVLVNTTDPARDQEFEDWYRNTHIPAALKTPGMVNAKMYVRAGSQFPGVTPAHKYLVVYDIEAADLNQVIQDFISRAGTEPEMQMSPVTDFANSTFCFYTELA